MSSPKTNQKKSSRPAEKKSKVPLFIRFLYSRMFLINVVIAAVLIYVVYLITMSSLDSYTNHDEQISVPNFIGIHTSELEAYAAEYDLAVNIVDSVFDDNAPKGTVLFQDPIEGDKVKRQRTVYVTMVSLTPQMMRMPKLIDKSSRQATSLLNVIGLEVKEIVSEPSDLCEGCVLKQLYRGVPIDSGMPIARGEAVTLVVGSRASARVPIPDLRSLTILEAKQRLNEQSLNLGAENFMNCVTAQDSASARIYKQAPAYARLGVIQLGGTIDVWLELQPDTAATAAPGANSGTNE